VVPADPRGIRRPPLKFDGKEHTPYRTALDRTLKPARLRRLEPVLAQRVDETLETLISQGHGDIYRDFGAPFCAFVEGRWLNLNETDAQALADNVPPFVQAWRTGNWDAVKKSSDGFYEIAHRVMAAREKELLDPEEDPATSLLMERDHDGNPLDKYHLM
jgi:cytochrome P450